MKEGDPAREADQMPISVSEWNQGKRPVGYQEIYETEKVNRKDIFLKMTPAEQLQFLADEARAADRWQVLLDLAPSRGLTAKEAEEFLELAKIVLER